VGWTLGLQGPRGGIQGEGVQLATEKMMRLTMLVLVGLCFLLTVGWLVVGFWVPAAVFVMLGLIGLRSALRIPSSK
jgi:hypothetical protein